MDEEISRTAIFTNFTDKPFTGYWNSKGTKFAPGDSRRLPEYLARHYAKHLANQVLLEMGKEHCTSPKYPSQVPEYMEQFNKACWIDETAPQKSVAEIQAESVPTPSPLPSPTIVDQEPPQIIEPPAGDDEEFEKA